jgi:hypothetical protein
MPEIDLTPTEPTLYDGEWKRATLRGLAKQLGHDHRDDPRVARGIEYLCESRIQTSPDKKSYTVVDKDGEPIRGAFAMKRLVQELLAKIEEEEGPSLEEIKAVKLATESYGL